MFKHFVELINIEQTLTVAMRLKIHCFWNMSCCILLTTSRYRELCMSSALFSDLRGFEMTKIILELKFEETVVITSKTHQNLRIVDFLIAYQIINLFSCKLCILNEHTYQKKHLLLINPRLQYIKQENKCLPTLIF